MAKAREAAAGDTRPEADKKPIPPEVLRRVTERVWQLWLADARIARERRDPLRRR